MVELLLEVWLPPPRTGRTYPTSHVRLRREIGARLLEGRLAADRVGQLADAATENRSVAWLDHGDRQPATFWTYVMTALQTAGPDVGASVLPLLQSAQPPIETVPASLLNELSTAPNDVDLVLDDYHLAAGHPGGHGVPVGAPPAARAYGDQQPRRPALAVGSAAGRSELVEVRAADLRFTPR